MNSGITSERVYAALKRRLLGGEFRPGERLDPALLADTLSSSVTPVRDVLNILRGEGLVETRTGEGFFRPHITAPDLEDLYLWSEQILWLAIRHWRDDVAMREISPKTGDDRISAFFLAIAEQSRNAEHARAITSISDRLQSVRLVEERLFQETQGELSAMEAAFARNDARSLNRLSSLYHRRRRRSASDIVRAVYRST